MTYTVTITTDHTIVRTFETLPEALDYLIHATCRRLNIERCISDVWRAAEHIVCIAGVWIHVTAGRLH